MSCPPPTTTTTPLPFVEFPCWKTRVGVVCASVLDEHLPCLLLWLVTQTLERLWFQWGARNSSPVRVRVTLRSLKVLGMSSWKQYLADTARVIAPSLLYGALLAAAYLSLSNRCIWITEIVVFCLMCLERNRSRIQDDFWQQTTNDISTLWCTLTMAQEQTTTTFTSSPSCQSPTNRSAKRTPAHKKTHAVKLNMRKRRTATLGVDMHSWKHPKDRPLYSRTQSWKNN